MQQLLFDSANPYQSLAYFSNHSSYLTEEQKQNFARDADDFFLTKAYLGETVEIPNHYVQRFTEVDIPLLMQVSERPIHDKRRFLATAARVANLDLSCACLDAKLKVISIELIRTNQRGESVVISQGWISLADMEKLGLESLCRQSVLELKDASPSVLQALQEYLEHASDKENWSVSLEAFIDLLAFAEERKLPALSKKLKDIADKVDIDTAIAMNKHLSKFYPKWEFSHSFDRRLRSGHYSSVIKGISFGYRSNSKAFSSWFDNTAVIQSISRFSERFSFLRREQQIELASTIRDCFAIKAFKDETIDIPADYKDRFVHIDLPFLEQHLLGDLKDQDKKQLQRERFVASVLKVCKIQDGGFPVKLMQNEYGAFPDHLYSGWRASAETGDYGRLRLSPLLHDALRTIESARNKGGLISDDPKTAAISLPTLFKLYSISGLLSETRQAILKLIWEKDKEDQASHREISTFLAKICPNAEEIREKLKSRRDFDKSYLLHPHHEQLEDAERLAVLTFNLSQSKSFCAFEFGMEHLLTQSIGDFANQTELLAAYCRSTTHYSTDIIRLLFRKKYKPALTLHDTVGFLDSLIYGGQSESMHSFVKGLDKAQAKACYDFLKSPDAAEFCSAFGLHNHTLCIKIATAYPAVESPSLTNPQVMNALFDGFDAKIIALMQAAISKIYQGGESRLSSSQSWEGHIKPVLQRHPFSAAEIKRLIAFLESDECFRRRIRYCPEQISRHILDEISSVLVQIQRHLPLDRIEETPSFQKYFASLPLKDRQFLAGALQTYLAYRPDISQSSYSKDYLALIYKMNDYLGQNEISEEKALEIYQLLNTAKKELEKEEGKTAFLDQVEGVAHYLEARYHIKNLSLIKECLSRFATDKDPSMRAKMENLLKELFRCKDQIESTEENKRIKILRQLQQACRLYTPQDLMAIRQFFALSEVYAFFKSAHFSSVIDFAMKNKFESPRLIEQFLSQFAAGENRRINGNLQRLLERLFACQERASSERTGGPGQPSEVCQASLLEAYQAFLEETAMSLEERAAIHRILVKEDVKIFFRETDFAFVMDFLEKRVKQQEEGKEGCVVA